MIDHGTSVWIDGAVARLQQAGYTEVSTDLASRTSTVVRALRRSEFRFSWFVTRMHVFVLLWESPVVGAADLAAFRADAVAWARSVKGGLPNGLQSGVAVLPVAVTRGAIPEVIAEASRRPSKEWAAIALPVVVDLDTGRAHTYADKMRWGSVYQHFLGQQQSIVIDDLTGNTAQLSPARALLRTAAMSVVTALLMIAAIALVLSVV